MADSSGTAPPVPFPDGMLRRIEGALDAIDLWRGNVPAGQARNFVGAMMPEDVAAGHPGVASDRYVTTAHPQPHEGEGYMEWYSTVRSVERARDAYVMVSLGAHYGGPLVNAALVLRALNPMPMRLIAVEGDPHMCNLIRRHFADNAIDPDTLTIVNALVSDSNAPLFFPVTEQRTGANVAMHNEETRSAVFQAIRDQGLAEKVLENLLLHDTTGVRIPLVGTDAEGELKLVSAVTVADVVGPQDRVDYLEIDIQWSEYFALPPAMELLGRRVGWVHLGTHGQRIHDAMAALFRDHGWDIHVDLSPDTGYETPKGRFRTQDGVLAAANPAWEPGGR